MWKYLDQAKIVTHKAGRAAHKCEHPLHLAYFGGLGTGFINYHWVALTLFALGIFVWLTHSE